MLLLNQEIQISSTDLLAWNDGFQDCLYNLDISYASEEAIKFADYCTEIICYNAYSASCDLARERGKYSSYDGSLWSKGILPLDSLDLLESEREVLWMLIKHLV